MKKFKVQIHLFPRYFQFAWENLSFRRICVAFNLHGFPHVEFSFFRTNHARTVDGIILCKEADRGLLVKTNASARRAKKKRQQKPKTKRQCKLTFG